MIGCNICFKGALWEIIPKLTEKGLYKTVIQFIPETKNKFIHLQVVKLHLFEVFPQEA